MVEAIKPPEEMLANATLPVFEFWVEGVTPLLMNSPHSMGGGDDSLGRKKIPSPKDEAESKCYRLGNGQLYLPSRAFRSSAASAAKGRKIGKVFATMLVRGSVFDVTEASPLVDPETGETITDYDVFVTRAVVGKSGVMRARPRIPAWGTKVLLEVDTEAISPTSVEELLGIAGRAVGVGDWRPEKDGPYGRFRAELVGEVASYG